MRVTPIWRLLTLLLLLAGAFAVPSVPVVDDTGFASVAAQDDDNDEDDEREDDKEEREDEKEERKEDKEENRQEKEDNQDDDQDDDDGANPVEPSAAYGVDVACTSTADATSTECTFTAVAPTDGKKVSHLVIPEDAICADVLDGDFDRVDPDPNTNVTGYRATGNEPSLLILDGQVTTGGAATYWLKVASEIFPATGPGFFCDEPAAAGPADLTAEIPDATPPATPDDEPATGTLTVSTYGCTGVPADTTEFDWYGACDVGGDHRFVLAPAEDDASDLLAADTVKSGEATFTDLPPGLYDLDDIDANWCHAESDAVNAEGDVVVEAGADTTVWLFYCQDGSSG